MNSAYKELLEVVKKHRDDGFEVPAVRMPEKQYEDLLCDVSFIMAHDEETLGNYEFEYDEAVGLIANTEVIVDNSISGVVAEDVRGMWREKY